MINTINNKNDINKIASRKILNLKVEKLVREASDNFIYFKDYKKALEQVNEVLCIEPDHVRALLLKGHVLFSLDRDNEALEYFMQASIVDPLCSEALGAKAGALDALGNTNEALDCCNTAINNITLKNRYLLTSLYDQKISILIRLKKYEEAKKALNKCTKLLQDDDIHYLISSYQGIINAYCKEKEKKREQAKKIAMQIIN